MLPGVVHAIKNYCRIRRPLEGGESRLYSGLSAIERPAELSGIENGLMEHTPNMRSPVAQQLRIQGYGKEAGECKQRRERKEASSHMSLLEYRRSRSNFSSSILFVLTYTFAIAR